MLFAPKENGKKQMTRYEIKKTAPTSFWVGWLPTVFSFHSFQNRNHIYEKIIEKILSLP